MLLKMFLRSVQMNIMCEELHNLPAHSKLQRVINYAVAICFQFRTMKMKAYFLISFLSFFFVVAECHQDLDRHHPDNHVQIRSE